MCVLLHYNFEAIHNKDYSVVKTFRAAFGSSCPFSPTLYPFSLFWNLMDLIHYAGALALAAFDDLLGNVAVAGLTLDSVDEGLRIGGIGAASGDYDSVLAGLHDLVVMLYDE